MTPTVSVDVPEPGAGMGFRLNLDCFRLDDKVIAELNPPVAVVVTVETPMAPRFTVIAAGLSVSVKLPVGAGASALSNPLPFGLPQPVARS